MNITSRPFRFVSLAALALAAAAMAQPAADPYTEVLNYRISQPRDATAAIEADIRAASPAQLRTIEGRLLNIIQSPQATRDAKDWACRLLRQVGTTTTVPVLGRLLGDTELSDAAQFALRSIAGSGVDAVLREAVGQVPASLRPGVIQTIGVRGDRQAVPILAPLAADADAVMAEAALNALGQIGGLEALNTLKAVKPPERLVRSRAHALLRCAESLLAEDKAAAAANLYSELYQDPPDATIQSAALRGIVRSDPARTLPVLMAALKDSRTPVRVAAAKLTSELPSGSVLSQLFAEMAVYSPDVQVIILSSTSDRAALKATRAVVTSADSAVRLAALDTLGRLGGGDDVLVLLEVAAARTGEEQTAARKALTKLRAPDVDVRLITSARGGEAAVRVEAIRTLASRQAKYSETVLLEFASESNPVIAAAAFDALGVIADPIENPSVLSDILGLLANAGKDRAEASAIAVCRRCPNKPAVAAMVIKALPGPSLAARCALLRVLASIPTENAMATLLAAAQDPDASVQDIAVRALAEWPDRAVLPSLLNLARTAANPIHRTLAFRGSVRLTRDQGIAPTARLRMLTEIASVARSPDDKKLVIGALAEVPLADAVEVVLKWLPDQDLDVEAASVAVRIAKQVRKSNPEAARGALNRVRELVQKPAARQMVENVTFLNGLENIAAQGVATSPDGWQKDGAAGGDPAGIDGNLETYWDKDDGKPLYRYVVTFKQPETIAALSIVGWAHHNFAPKDLAVLCDQKVVQKVENARYDDNFLALSIPETGCTTVELRITGYYGASPAIRELGIYRRLPTGNARQR